MKFSLLILLFLASFTSFGQQLDSCGISDNPQLNKYEGEYLNGFFKNQRGNFEFTNQKALFITGSSGSIIGSKSDYFNDVKLWHLRNNTVASSFILLDDEQVAKSGGYNVLITYWVKLPITPAKVFKKLPAKAIGEPQELNSKMR